MDQSDRQNHRFDGEITFDMTRPATYDLVLSAALTDFSCHGDLVESLDWTREQLMSPHSLGKRSSIQNISALGDLRPACVYVEV